MENETLSVGVNQSSSVPQGPKRKPLLFLVLILVVLLLLVIGEIFFYLYLKNKAKRSTGSPTPIVSDEVVGLGSLTGLEIGKEVLSWLDQQRDERGVYYLNRRCNTYPEIDCLETDPSGSSGHVAIAPIWGRFKYYQNKKDQNDLQIIGNDLKIITDQEKIQFIQNDFWNCYLMYDLWKSSDFSEEQKELIEKICWESAYYLPKDLETIRERKFVDGQYQDVIQAEVKLVKAKGITSGLTIEEEEESMVDEYSIYPVDFLARYRWRKDENDLKKAFFYFNKAAQLYSQKSPLFNLDEICLFGVSVAELSMENNDQDYLDWAKGIFAEVKANNITKPVKCAFFANVLYGTTGEDEYLQEKKDILDKLIENTFDYENSEFKGYLVGDGSFRSLDENGNAGLVKSIRENGLLVGILSGL